MNKPGNPMDAETFEAYLLGQLSDEQVAALEQTLIDDPKAMEQLAEAMQVISLVRQEFAGQAEYKAANQQDPLLEDFNAMLKELGECEAAAETITLPVHDTAQTQAEEDAGQVSAHDLFAAGSYLLRHSFTPKVVMAFAAMLILGLTLLIALSGNDSVQPPIADDLRDPGLVGPGDQDVVATLTAQNDAQWASDTPTTGDALAQGQRLALTQGFAEITTRRGAVVILEAPCTFELTDSPNAVRLIAGKLIGICETPSSKGFAVHTGQAVITDLGTRFGVAIDSGGNLFAEVFTGSIAVRSMPGVTSQPITETLHAGASIALNPQARPIASVGLGDSSFVRLLESAVGVVRVTGQVAAAKGMLNSLMPDDLAPNANAYLFQESITSELKSDIDLSIVSPGEYVDFIDQAVAATLPAGQRLRSYALIIRPDPNTENSVYRGSITFDGEILGVIADVKTWQRFTNATDGPSFMVPPAVEQLLEGSSSGIDPSKTDTITLHADQRTLSFHANASQHFDAIRILVRAEPSQAP